MEGETQRIARLTPLAVVLERIGALAAPVEPRRLTTAAALGRVLAEDVVAASAVPAVARALRDGFAVAADALSDASSYAPVPLAAPQRVDVGDGLPASADAVAPLDIVVGRDRGFDVIAPVAPGDGVLAAGADVRGGTVLRRAGDFLRAADLAAVATAGIGEVSIRAPRIHVASARPGGDAAIDAAVRLLESAVAASGATLATAGGDLAAAFADTNADAVIAIGGTGAGRNDVSVRTLAAAGRVEIHGIALSPGETAAIGVVGGRPVLLFPGRIDATLAVWLTIGRRLVARLAGDNRDMPEFPAVLTRKHASPLGLTELVPVRVRSGKAEPIASGYWPLEALAHSDGWILVTADSEGYPAGTEVMIRPWP